MPIIDLSGKQFAKLIVIKPNGTEKNGALKWLCQCTCENKTLVTVRGRNLRNGTTKSCGCYKKELNAKRRKFNKFKFLDDYIIGYTESNKEFYFNLEDYELIKDYYWNIKSSYVYAWINKKRISLHRFLMNPNKNEVVDHINHINFDNRRKNLRICTTHQNTMNEKIAKNNISGKTGVSFDNSSQKWRAYINVDKKSKKLGTFLTKEEAIKARLKAEVEIFGEFRNKEQGDYYGEI